MRFLSFRIQATDIDIEANPWRHIPDWIDIVRRFYLRYPAVIAQIKYRSTQQIVNKKLEGTIELKDRVISPQKSELQEISFGPTFLEITVWEKEREIL